VRAKAITGAMSSVDAARTMADGRLSIIPFQTAHASS